MRRCTVLLFVLVFVAQCIVASGETRPVIRISESGTIDRISREVTLNTISQKRYLAEEGNENETWRKKHPVGFGTVVGLSIGFGVGFVFGASSDDITAAGALLFGGALGAIGACIGALIGSFSEY